MQNCVAEFVFEYFHAQHLWNDFVDAGESQNLVHTWPFFRVFFEQMFDEALKSF